MKSLLAILYLYQLCSASALEESDAGVSGDREGKVRIGCGQKTSENCTILQPTLETMGARSCQYDVCRCNPNVCRIRFDLTKFQIAGPVEGLTVPELTDTPSTTNGASIGDCATDQFSVSSPGSFGSPVICGYNEGQHMFVDANEMCSKALFTFGSGTAMREWEIKVTQYACGDDNGGPPGCLQYHTGTVGSFASFNFPTADTMVGPTGTLVAAAQMRPFRVTFVTNGDEITALPDTIVTNPGDPRINEQGAFPGGIVGFNLNYQQIDC
eukprot:maker-scaffold767_size101014-snap-gene-0.9 protein:Tk12205 transcript:maker-scaffold767_size101014-snap-gene-0.9-mRNA-1 annotation:"PREDICTED: uncharacterized protein LOC100903241"